MLDPEQTPRRSTKKLRCAIYTRKSTDEGLEQAFNSLDSQREACAAFIQSQKHEGWTVSPTRTMTEGSPAARCSDRPCSGCWPISRLARSM